MSKPFKYIFSDNLLYLLRPGLCRIMAFLTLLIKRTEARRYYMRDNRVVCFMLQPRYPYRFIRTRYLKGRFNRNIRLLDTVDQYLLHSNLIRQQKRSFWGDAHASPRSRRRLFRKVVPRWRWLFLKRALRAMNILDQLDRYLKFSQQWPKKERGRLWNEFHHDKVARSAILISITQE